MSRADALEALGLSSQDFGPCYSDTFTYEEFAAAWRGTAPCPTEEELKEAVKNHKHVPNTVTMRQARLALLNAGKLAAVNATIMGIPGIQGEIVRINWEWAHDVERDNDLVLSFSAALNLSKDKIDDLFIAASKL